MSFQVVQHDLKRQSQKIQAWLRICDEIHHICLRWTSMIGRSNIHQTRVHKLNANSEKPTIRLVLRKEISPQKCPNVTLSHYWGRKLPTKLLQQKIEKFRSNVSRDTLPLTFQDTFLAVPKFGLEYLWIDALCIIQDDEDDWTR